MNFKYLKKWILHGSADFDKKVSESKKSFYNLNKVFKQNHLVKFENYENRIESLKLIWNEFEDK